MQNIIITLLFILGTLCADSVGVAEKSWVDAPTVPTTTINDMEIGEEYVVPSGGKIITSTPLGQTINKTEPFINLKAGEEYGKMLIAFIDPLVVFVRDNMVLFGSLVALFTLLFYILFYRPLAKRVHQNDDEDIIIPQAVREKEAMKTPITPDSSIISQRQYSTIYGLVNETFIYEKESVMLDKTLTQEQRNRDVISLEWKFNQILHFSLPKLSDNHPKRFKEGVKELVEEEITRDIMITALEDILKEEKLSTEDKISIKKIIEPFSKKERRENKAVNNPKPQAINYTNYMGQ